MLWLDPPTPRRFICGMEDAPTTAEIVADELISRLREIAAMLSLRDNKDTLLAAANLISEQADLLDNGDRGMRTLRADNSALLNVIRKANIPTP